MYSFPGDIQALENDIYSFEDSNGLFFLATMGNIRHSIDEANPGFAPAWEQLVQTLNALGAEPMTVRILGENQPAFDRDGADDYLLVGKMEAYAPPVREQWQAGLQTKFTAQESGYAIYRHTLKNATSPTQVEGVLVPGHQGYYTPHMQSPKHGFLVPQIAAVTSASLLAPTVWPYSTADQSPSTTQGEEYAYN